MVAGGGDARLCCADLGGFNLGAVLFALLGVWGWWAQMKEVISMVRWGLRGRKRGVGDMEPGGEVFEQEIAEYGVQNSRTIVLANGSYSCDKAILVVVGRY